ncbi:uncharacterized protein LOC128995338 [Macrosteles quadrilineatus]|uniref:uncharacterized protein LOC128995338 n=1 Tax=Macrosteles quadrilineatus TaxID=74068 RepID=UPI0023E20C14|nr:uncharacterized protein LOC128995338 [Macrosteles quadrilineatus]
MRLSDILFRGFKIPGARFRGKTRMVKKVTPLAMNDLRNDYRLEEQNMLYLRHPFLTLEQSKLLKEHLKQQHVPAVINSIAERNEKYAKKSLRIVDYLKHLNKSTDWDVIK